MSGPSWWEDMGVGTEVSGPSWCKDKGVGTQVSGLSWWENMGAGTQVSGHFASALGKQKEMSSAAQLAFSLLFSPGPPPICGGLNKLFLPWFVHLSTWSPVGSVVHFGSWGRCGLCHWKWALRV